MGELTEALAELDNERRAFANHKVGGEAREIGNEVYAIADRVIRARLFAASVEEKRCGVYGPESMGPLRRCPSCSPVEAKAVTVPEWLFDKREPPSAAELHAARMYSQPDEDFWTDQLRMVHAWGYQTIHRRLAAAYQHRGEEIETMQRTIRHVIALLENCKEETR